MFSFVAVGCHSAVPFTNSTPTSHSAVLLSLREERASSSPLTFVNGRTMRSQISPLVTVSWLKETIATKPANFQVLDASWHVPAFKRDAPKEFAKRHIPTAQFFQIDTYSAKLPTQEQFGEDVGKLGVGNDTHVIVYDNNAKFGMFSAPRAWWLFRYFGHENVSILDGGFPKWEQAGYETTADVDKVKSKTFKATPNTVLLKTIEDIEANIEKKQFTLVDQRPAGRFLGTAPEPRPEIHLIDDLAEDLAGDGQQDIKPGHIKGSVSIPFTLLIDSNTKQMKSADAIGEVFRNAFVDLENTPIVATCGAGGAACFAVLGAYICGKRAVPLYNGSWTDYFFNGKPENKIQTTSGHKSNI
ncbi:3-mercaptopyruvate sulfurtransferase [Lamellibrachia satsuma]|nr:3-mercaptopyruvate sulfurtransferase [Lamellibrachia satsuma]